MSMSDGDHLVGMQVKSIERSTRGNQGQRPFQLSVYVALEVQTAH